MMADPQEISEEFKCQSRGMGESIAEEERPEAKERLKGNPRDGLWD